MSERFDILFQGLEEESALKLILANPDDLANPVDKYMAATRLGASQTPESLDVLIQAIDLDPENLFNRITRRKAAEALGRRKDPKALPGLFKALGFGDEAAVINAVDSISQIGAALDQKQCDQLLSALEGSDNIKRAVIQCHTRLGLKSGMAAVKSLQNDENPLVSGAARAYSARVFGECESLKPLLAQLTDPIAGRRRAAVIDLGDAGDATALPALAKAPVSMPLRAKSAFQLVDPEKTGSIPMEFTETIRSLLIDDPRSLWLQDDWICEASTEAIEKNLQHRDEGKQYGGIASLMQMDRGQQIRAIELFHQKLWSDYGANYLLTSLIGLEKFDEKSELVRTALAETLPQYAKSRIAAAWACLKLGLRDQLGVLTETMETARWVPLKWSCEQVLKELS